MTATDAVVRAFAARLRANADRADELKFSVANLGTLSIEDCRVVAAALAEHAAAPVGPRNLDDKAVLAAADVLIGRVNAPEQEIVSATREAIGVYLSAAAPPSVGSSR